MVKLRSLAFNVFFFASTVVLLLLPGVAVRLFAPRHALALARFWARLELAALRVLCGISVRIEGREHLPASGAALLASHHESAFDTLVWLTLLPRPCYVLKAELLKIPIFGSLVRPAGMIPVDRSGGAGAVRALAREGARAVAEERQLVIFPEGTRAEPGRLLPLQPGIAAMAAATGLRVIPVVTDSGSRWGRRAFHKRPGVIRIRLLPPLPAGQSRAALMAGLNAALAEGMAALAASGSEPAS